MLDSARFYLMKAEPLFENISHLEALAGLFYLRYMIEKQNHDYKKSLEYCELFSKYQMQAVDKSDRQALLEIQKKYDNSAKENEYNKVRRKLWQALGILACISLVLTVIIFRIQKKIMRQKTALLKIEHEKYQRDLSLEKAERKVQEKELELVQTKANKEKARKAYTQEDNLTQKTHEIVKELQAQNFIDIANEFYPGFTEELKKHCQDLDDRELCTCCLILFEFSNEELDLFINDRFNGTLNTVQHWKSTIRRKLGVPAYGDIKKYLLQNILKEIL